MSVIGDFPISPELEALAMHIAAKVEDRLCDRISSLEATTERELRGVNDRVGDVVRRLDAINGRVGKSEDAISDLRVSVAETVATGKQARATLRAMTRARPITKRDLFIAIGALAGAGGFVTWFFQIAPYIRLSALAGAH